MKRNFINTLFTVSVMLFLALGFVGLLFGKADTSRERRTARTMPPLSISSFFDRETPGNIEGCLADRFAFRPELISINAAFSLAMHGGEHRDVIRGHDGIWITEQPMTDTTAYSAGITQFIAFYRACLEAGISFTIAPVPTATTVHRSALPLEYRSSDVDLTALLREALPPEALCDIETPLLTAGEGAYFLTDHHWNERGARLAADTVLRKLGCSSVPPSGFETVCRSFCGTSLSRLGLLGTPTDTLRIPHFEDENDYVVYTGDDDRYLFGFYDYEKATGVDAYSVYLGGNHGLIRVARDAGEKRETLLVVRDSYASSVVPYLAHHFDLVLLDPRYAGDTAATIMRRFDVSGVLILAEITALGTRPFSLCFSTPPL